MTEAWPERSRLDTTSLEELLAALRAATAGDFGKRLGGSSDPLLDDIAAAFNELTERLAERDAPRSRFLPTLSHELRTPLNSMVVLARLLAGNPEGNLTPRQVEYANVIHSAGADLVQVISDLGDPGGNAGHPGANEEPEAEADEEPATQRRVLVVEAARGGLLTLLARGAVSDLPGEQGPVSVQTAATADEVAEALAAGQHDCVVLDLEAAGHLASGTMERARAVPPGRRVPVLAHARDDAATALFARLRDGTETAPAELLRSPDELRERIAWHLSQVPSRSPVSQSPLPQSAVPPIPGKAQAARHATLCGKKILVVDDDPRNVFAITSTLEHYGMTVLRSGDGREGIDQLRNEPDTDLVLMDLMMPGMDGYAAISAIRDIPEFSDLPIIVVTAHTMSGNLADSVPGADDCVTKPLDTDELLGRMARHLALR
jgi:CheY-like chemotaxis protein